MEGEASSQRKQRHSFPNLSILFACENQTRSSSTVGVLVVGGKSSLKSHTECKDLFKPRKGEPTHRADNQANCLSGAILF